MEVGQLGGGTTIALILIMSFAIDRTVAGLMFYFSYKGWVQDPSELLNNPPDQEKTDEGTVEGEEGEAKEREAEKREAERREAQLQAKKRYKLWWFRLTLVFVLPILCLEKYRILTAMGIRQPTAWDWSLERGLVWVLEWVLEWVLDIAITGIVLLGGADVFKSLKNTLSAAETELSDRRPIQVEGDLELKEEKKSKKGSSSAP